MKRKIVLILSILIIGLLVNLFLYRAANHSDIKNHFNRRFDTDSIQLKYTIHLDNRNYYFAGWIDSTCYLGRSSDAFRLVALQRQKVQSIFITRPINSSCRYSNVSVDAPYFQFADLETNSIYRGSVSNWTIRDTVHLKSLFSEELPISKTSSVIRDLDSSRSKFILSKETYWPSRSIIHSDELIEKQIDGLFSTDGMLRYDRKTKQIVYTYYYRNQFFVADTSLQLLSRCRTIDTVSIAKIKVATNSSTQSKTLSSPPLLVNRYSYAYDGKLYVASSLMADNESHSSFRVADVIDVYSIPKGIYLTSFYLPRVNKKKLLHFAVHEKELFVLQDVTLSVYRLPDIKDNM